MASRQMSNAGMLRLFRCNESELQNLKRAYKNQMQQTFVNGTSIIYHLFGDIDEDGSLRAGMWDAVAGSSNVFDSMLSGSRWVPSKPQDFEISLARAKDAIFRSLNRRARQSRRAKSVKRRAPSRTPSTLSISSASTLLTPQATAAKRTCERLKNKMKTKPYPVRLLPKSAANNSMAATDAMTDDDNESDFIKYEIPEGENIVVARPEYGVQTADERESLPPATPEITHRLESIIGSSATSDGTSNVSRWSAEHVLPNPFHTSPSWSEHPVHDKLRDKTRTSEEFWTQDRTPRPDLTLSARIQEAVDRSMYDLEARLVRNVEVMLASRDAEIERLKADLEREKAGRGN